MHSNDYRNLAQLQPGGVLIAGAGNSGAELAMETARGGHQTWMSGRDTGHIPFRPEGFLGRNLLAPLVLRFVFHRLLTVRTPLGRKARPKVLAKGAPLIRVKPRDLAAAGVQRVPRVVGVRDGRPLLEDGRALDVANVIWCSGFHPGFEWIDLPIFGDDGELLHQGGVVESQPGLYFVGLTFLYAMSSSMIHGVSRDAARIVKAIAMRLDAGVSTQDRFARGRASQRSDPVASRTASPRYCRSDLEQMPHLLDFLRNNGTLVTNDHTVLISHTAGGILSSLTGVYPDRHGQTVSNSYVRTSTTGTFSFPSSFGYWTDVVSAAGTRRSRT